AHCNSGCHNGEHPARIRLQLPIYFCLHRGKCPSKDHRLARPFRSVDQFRRCSALVENSAMSDRANREASNDLFSRDFSGEKEIHSTPSSGRKHANTAGIAFLSVCVLVGLVAFFAGAHAQVATPVPVATATPAPTATPVSNFCATQHSAPMR